MTLTADELAWMRDVVEASLPDTCSVLEAQMTDDGMGGKTVTWAVATSDVPCRLDPLSGDERYSGDKMTAFARYRILVPYDTTVTAAHRLRVNGVDYHILFVDAGKSWPLAKRIEAERVE